MEEKEKRNAELLTRAGGTTHPRRTVLLVWIVAAAGVFLVSRSVGTRNANNFSLPNTGSQHAVDLLQSRFPAEAGDTDQIVFRTRAGRVDAPAVRRVVVPLLERVSRLPHVTAVVSPYD